MNREGRRISGGDNCSGGCSGSGSGIDRGSGSGSGNGRGRGTFSSKPISDGPIVHG